MTKSRQTRTKSLGEEERFSVEYTEREANAIMRLVGRREPESNKNIRHITKFNRFNSEEADTVLVLNYLKHCREFNKKNS